MDAQISRQIFLIVRLADVGLSSHLMVFISIVVGWCDDIVEVASSSKIVSGSDAEDFEVSICISHYFASKFIFAEIVNSFRRSLDRVRD